MARKKFNAAAQFITSTSEEQETTINPDPENLNKNVGELLESEAEIKKFMEKYGNVLPAGYKLAKETKSERIQLMVRPSTKKVLKELAFDRRLSLNDLINQILEEYIERS